MKIIVTGSLGNISKPLATELVQQGHAVTVISSQPERRAAIEALGATAAIGSFEDTDFLAATFAGADALYAMVAGGYQESDSRAYFQRIGRHYAQAIQQAGVRRVVHLSSWGAHRDHGTGGILGSHDVEEILAAVAPRASMAARRSGWLLMTVTAWPCRTSSVASGWLMFPREPVMMIFMEQSSGRARAAERAKRRERWAKVRM